MTVDTIIEIMDNKDRAMLDRLGNEHKIDRAFVDNFVFDVYDMATDDDGHLIKEQLSDLIDDKLETLKANILDELEKLMYAHTNEAETHLQNLEIVESCYRKVI